MTYIHGKKDRILERNNDYAIIFFAKKESISNWSMNISLKGSSELCGISYI